MRTEKIELPRVVWDGDQAVIEARSMTEATDVADATFGGAWRQVSARRVPRGGVAGFFATEIVELVAARAGSLGATDVSAPSMPERATAESLLGALGGDAGGFADLLRAAIAAPAHPAPVASMPPVATAAVSAQVLTLDDAPARGRSIADVLAHLAEAAPRGESDADPFVTAPVVAAPVVTAPVVTAPVVTAPVVTAPVVAAPVLAAPVVAQPVAVATGSVERAWDLARLEVLGVPARIVEALVASGATCDDELTAVAISAVRPFIGAAPSVPSVVAGPHAARLAAALGLRVVDRSELLTGDGSAVIVTRDAADLAGAGNGRALHLVVGGDWSALSTLHPDCVSAASPADVPAALRVAVAHDVPLVAVVKGRHAYALDAVSVATMLRALAHGAAASLRSPTIGLDWRAGRADTRATGGDAAHHEP